MMLRVANGAGFLGDWLEAPRQLVTRAELDYLTLEYLAELTMSILARQREKDPAAGYAEDFLTVLRSIAGELSRQSALKIVTNAGGVNPLACAQAAGKLLEEHGLCDVRIGVVHGDDLLPNLAQILQSGGELRNLDTNEPLGELRSRVVSANAYLGAEAIVKALAADARIVITGRVADASLTVGPAIHHFGWRWDDWQRIAGATAAGHLIECGAQVTGGYSTSWQQIPLANIGYPIAELAADGSCVITKPAGTDGEVNRRTVTEQLVYEIGDPSCYRTPDVDLDLTQIELTEIGPQRVRVQHAVGKPPSDCYKVSLAYRDGYFASGELLVAGEDCLAKGERCAAMLGERLRLAGIELARTNVELLGSQVASPASKTDHLPREIMLRITAHDPRREALERFTREFAPLITSGPAGLAGYAAGRPAIRPVFAYWPTLVPKTLVTPQMEVQTAQQWASR